jgi:hypothetical protein
MFTARREDQNIQTKLSLFRSYLFMIPEVVERLSGKDFETYLNQNFFEI